MAKTKSSESTMHKSLPHDVTMGVLLVVLLASAFLVVLPRLQSMQALPQHYYNLLPVATQTGDVDRDGVPDNLDPTPYGHRSQGIGSRTNQAAPAAVELEESGEIEVVEE